MATSHACSGGSVHLPGGLLHWQWTGQCRRDVMQKADRLLQGQGQLLGEFLRRQEDVISIFIEGLLATSNGVNESELSRNRDAHDSNMLPLRTQEDLELSRNRDAHDSNMLPLRTQEDLDILAHNQAVKHPTALSPHSNNHDQEEGCELGIVQHERSQSDLQSHGSSPQQALSEEWKQSKQEDAQSTPKMVKFEPPLLLPSSDFVATRQEIVSKHAPALEREITKESKFTTYVSTSGKFVSKQFVGRLLSLRVARQDIRMKRGDSIKHRLASAGVRDEFVYWAHWWATLKEPDRKGRLAKFTHSIGFELGCVIVIVLNTFFMISSTNYSARHQTEQEPKTFVVAEGIFLGFYTIEIVLKLSVHRLYFFCNDLMLWNIFDLCIVGFSATNAFILASMSNNLAFLRTLRVLKLSKLFRIFRVIVILRDLRIMLNCVVNSFMSLMWCFALLALIGLIFAMFFVQALTRYLTEAVEDVNDTQLELIQQRFSSVQEGMVTLFMIATGGIDWILVYNLVASTGPVNLAALLFFIGFFHVSIFNIVTGLFVEKALKFGRPDQEMEVLEHRKEAMNKVRAIKALCLQLDIDRSGTIARSEFMRCMKDPSIRFAFSLEGMDIRDAEAFFDMLSTVSGSEEVDIDTFVAGCLRMRGLATALDLQTLGFELKLQQVTLQELNQKILTLICDSKTDPKAVRAKRVHRAAEIDAHDSMMSI